VEPGDRASACAYPRPVRNQWYFYGFPPGAPGWVTGAASSG